MLAVETRAIRKDPRKYPIIAAQYDVNRETIGNIKRRETLEAFSLTNTFLARAERNLHLFDPEQKIRLLALLEERDKRRKVLETQEAVSCRSSSASGLSSSGGRTHVLMAEAFEKVAKAQSTG